MSSILQPLTARLSPGFTLVELVVSMGIALVVAAAFVRLATAITVETGRQPGIADMQQRLRVAVEAIGRDVMQAGAGLNDLPANGTLPGFLPPVRPGRTGPTAPDNELSFAEDRVSITYVAEGALERHVYYLDRARARLMHYDGLETFAPVVDRIADLRFQYFADPDPSSVPWPESGRSSCLYAAGDPPVSVLRVLGPGPQPPIAARDLTDGPVCGTAPNRFDGDLLRIRRVRITLTVSPDDSPTPERPGHAPSDYTMSVDVTPRTLRTWR